MLVELAHRGNFFTTWLALTVAALVLMMAMSGTLFWFYYARPSFEAWQQKSNPLFPKPAMVRKEILQMLKGLAVATICPAAALHLVDSGWSHAYGGLGGYGVPYLIFTFFVAWIGSDLFEWAYHRLGHTTDFWWSQHRPHHAFANPSPFAVIADDAVDQFIRALPLLVIPLVMPINMDLLFLTYGAFFYGYGVYLHWGYELRFLDAHHPWINTSFQHYVHHARATFKKPIHTGFFFKLWDKLGKSEYQAGPAECLCAKCCQGRGERSRERWEKIEKPDYSVLLEPRFWVRGAPKDEAAVAS